MSKTEDQLFKQYAAALLKAVNTYKEICKLRGETTTNMSEIVGNMALMTGHLLRKEGE